MADELQTVFESVARYFGVLSEPARLRILRALCQGELCVNDILAVTGLGQANASRHLGLMHQVGMLSRRREGSQIYYKVADQTCVELCRSVSVQMAGRIDAVAGTRERFDHFSHEMSASAHPSA